MEELSEPIKVTINKNDEIVLETWPNVGKERGCKSKWAGVSDGMSCSNCFEETGNMSYTMKNYFVHYDPNDSKNDMDYDHGLSICKVCNCPGDWVTFCFKCKKYENE